MAFDRDTRNKLSSFVHQCRRLLCGEYDRPGGEIARLLAHYGIQVTGEVTEVDQLPHLDESGRDTARLLREILEFKRANTPQTRIWRQYDPAVYDLLQEQAFTVLNRLCALRMAEARGILQPCVSEKTQSAGFQLYEYQSGKSDDQGTRYRHFLFSVFDEIALDLPALFDRFSPQGLLFPSHSCIEALLDEINAEPLQLLWAEDETIGWIYQYWNSQEERRAMRDASAAPRNSRELAVRNQFFTPRYVVEFLTDNTLGRIWYEMCQGETRLREECRYLVRRPNEVFLGPGESAPEAGNEEESLSQEELLKQPVYIPHRPMKDPREIRLLDPACGSMHFGLYAFDLFETIYEEYWERSEGVPPSTTSLPYKNEGKMPSLHSFPENSKQRSEGVPPSTLNLSLKNEGETPSLRFLNPYDEITKRRTHLPHWEQDGVTYFLTWRLADSLPKEKLEAWKAERDAWLQAHPQPWAPETEDQYHRQFSDRLDDYLDAGAGRCLLKDPALGGLVADALRHFDGDRYLLDSFVVMPNHVHVIVRLENEQSLAKVLHSWKSYTAKEINRRLGESGTVWQEDYFDRIIRNERHLAATRRYIEDNPRKARLPEGSFQRSEGVPPSSVSSSLNIEGETPSLPLKDEGGTPSLRSLYPSKEAFLRDVPRLIIEHNIHGVDIDPRAVQIAGLSLWLRAQKTWQQANIPAQDRPQIMRSNVVCAEPMPGNIEQLQNFCESLNQPAIAGLVQHIFEKMQLAGEAGTLLKIEEEITELVATAKKDWLNEPKLKQAELFQPEELTTDHRPLTTENQSELGLDFSGVTDEAFWDKAEERIYAALQEYAESAEAGDYQRRLFAQDAAHGFAFIDLCRKRYDAVVMNPPFGDAGKQSKTYLARNYPITKSDMYSAFVERGLHVIERGILGAITSRSGFFQSSFTKWRTEVLLPEAPPSAVADLGSGVLDGAMVETAAYSLVKNSGLQTRGKSTFIRLGRTMDKESALVSAIGLAHQGVANNALFLIDPACFEAIPGTPFAYWVPPSIRQIFRTAQPFETDGCTVKQGLATADDFRFVRTLWEPYPHLIARTKSDEEKGRYWFPYPKGGEFSPFYADIPLVVNWMASGEQYWHNLSATGGVRSNIWMLKETTSDYFFRAGLTYPRRLHRLAVMPMPTGSIISVRGSGIYAPERELKRVAGLFSSSAFDFLVKCMLGRFDHPQFDNGTLCKTPVPAGFPLSGDKLEQPTNRAIYLKRGRDTTNELSHVFVCPPRPTSREASLGETITLWQEGGKAVNDEIENCQALIDEVAFGLYQFDAEARNAVYGSTNFGDRIDDDSIEDEVEEDEPIDVETVAPSFLSHALGTVLARWDIRYATGERQPPELPDPFDPLPVCPPGMLQGEDGLPLSKDELRRMNDEGSYPLRVTVDGILVDDANDPEDIVSRVREALRVIWRDGEKKVGRGQKAEGSREEVSSGQKAVGSEEKDSAYRLPPTAYSSSASAIEAEAIEILQGGGRTPKDLRDYFRTPGQFFASHLARYSKSRRKAPIYWPISTASGDYTLWLYYHRLDDQTLLRCVNRIKTKLESVASERARLANEPNRSSAQDTELKKLATFEEELRTLQRSLEAISKFWKPNLNDGVQITAAPLWEHFRHKPWQKVLKDTWKQLEHGDYDWAHLAHSIWPERVLPKCAQDRSLAIAHGHESRLWHQVEVEGKKKQKKLEWHPVPNAEEVVAEILEELKAS